MSEYSLIDSFKNAFLVSGAFVLLNFVVTFYIQNIKSKLLKDESLKEQEALGEGDIPILASLGIILGIKGALIAIFLSALFAIIPSIYFNITKKRYSDTIYSIFSIRFYRRIFFFNLSKVFLLKLKQYLFSQLAYTFFSYIFRIIFYYFDYIFS